MTDCFPAEGMAGILSAVTVMTGNGDWNTGIPEKSLLQKRESGASEIIGTLILIALIAGAISILGTVLFSQPVSGKIPAATIVITNESNIVLLYHEGGDSVPAADLSIVIDGNPATFSGAGSDGIWGTGETLTVISPAVPQKVTVLYNGSSRQIVFASGAPEPQS